MLCDFEIRIICKNNLCSNDLNIYKTNNEPNYKSNNFASEVNSKQKEIKNQLLYLYSKLLSLLENI